MVESKDVAEILASLLKQLEKTQVRVGLSQTEFALANAMAVLVSVLLHERQVK